MKKAKAPDTCNVIEANALGKHLWQFSVDGGKPKLEANLAAPADKPAPPNLVAKNWQTLWKPRLNIAWISTDQIFLRVVQMPKADAAEIASMLEFQLEKLSPLPVAQIIWSVELVPSQEINSVTAVLIIAAREFVEEQIGVLEQGGYQPDRLELPHVYQMIAEAPMSDGVWIYPWSEGGKSFCLAAWWFTGALRNLQLIQLPAGGESMAVVKEQLLQTVWAGEMEGWLHYPVRWRVVAKPDVGPEWLQLMQELGEKEPSITTRLPRERQAEFAAARAVRGEAAANLLPPEFAARYRQQFVDRLWMKGLFGAVALYLAAVFAYWVAVQIMRVRVMAVERQVAGLATTYTNTLRMRERVQVLQDQQALKYAALDSWKAASDLLPTEVTLTSLSFGNGQKLDLRGVADSAKAVADYNDALRGATLGGQPLFKNVSTPTSNARPGGGVTWGFFCDLNRQEVQ